MSAWRQVWNEVKAMKAEREVLKVRVLPMRYRMLFRADDTSLAELMGKIPERFRKRETCRCRCCSMWTVVNSDWAWAFMRWATMLGYEVEADFDG
jgi:hypothetical protein